MADNVPITAGTGTDVATDDVAGVHYQRVKLVDGTLDSTAAIPGDATNGLDVDVTRVQGNVTVQATDLDIRNLVHATDAVKVGDGTNFIDIDTAPTDGEVNGGKRLLHTEAWLWGYNGTTWDRLRSDTTNGLDVDVTRVSGNVTVVQSTAANLKVDASGVAVPVTDNSGSLTVDAPVGTPVYVRQSDGTSAHSPHSTTWKCVQSSTATTTNIWTPGSGKKIALTYLQIQAGGTTAGNVQVWFAASGDTTYNRGTDAVVFDGEFAPSATVKPGIVISFPQPLICPTADYLLKVTASAAINPLTVTAWGYEV